MRVFNSRGFKSGKDEKDIYKSPIKRVGCTANLIKNC